MRFLPPALLVVTSCSVNLAEMRPARVLQEGDMQVTLAGNGIVPTGIANDILKPGQDALDAARRGDAPGGRAARSLIGTATAVALSSPGVGIHLDVALGIGHNLDVSGRVGNGLYALGVRRGYWLGGWDTNVGLRLAYNTGSSLVPYFDRLNDYAKVAELKRIDTQLVAQAGREYGDWLKLWLGLKGLLSTYEGTLDGSRLGFGTERFDDRLVYYGGFAGLGLGFRWLHVLLELAVLQGHGDLLLFGERYDLSGLTLAPSVGLQASF